MNMTKAEYNAALAAERRIAIAKIRDRAAAPFPPEVLAPPYWIRLDNLLRILDEVAGEEPTHD